MEKLLLLMILLAFHGATAQTNLCEPIILTACQGLGYNMTSYPNSFGHISQQQAYNHLEPYLQLLDLQCSTYSKEFLCFLYVPVCTILDTVMLPCRSLCQRVRHDCLPTMKENGMSWPDEWRCKTFPKGDVLCVDSQNPSTAAPMTAASTTAAPTTTAAITTTKQECQPIAEGSICSSIGYTMTHLPNSLGHQNQDDALMELNTYYPLVKIACSAELPLFLCSLYLPKCTPSQTLPPCRQLCNKARDGCSELMLRFGHVWPDYMLCENFPDSNNSSVCVGAPSTAVIPTDAPSSTVIPTDSPSTTAVIPTREECQPIAEGSVCSSIGYTMTHMPNSLGHQNQDDALMELNTYYPLVKIACSAELPLFLCSLYLPKCTPSQTLPPCRQLCNKARDGCSDLMLSFGHVWPDYMSCENFPDSNSSSVCVGVPSSAVIPTDSPSSTVVPTDNPSTAVIPTREECQPIAEGSVCSSIGYTMTHMPNSLGHQNQDDALLELNSYTPIVKIGCSAELQLFLCSLYLPKCTPSQTLPPCRQLCNKARDGCSGLMLRFGHAWPDHMSCENFPDSNNSSVCVGVSSSAVIPTSQSVIYPTESVVAFEARYELSCDDVQKNKDWRQLVNSTAQANTAHLVDICGNDCSIKGVPDVGCRKGLLRIRWYTDLVYAVYTGRIDSAVKSKLRKRIKCKKSMLMTVSNPQPLQFQFPMLNKDGTSAKVILV